LTNCVLLIAITPPLPGAWTSMIASLDDGDSKRNAGAEHNGDERPELHVFLASARRTPYLLTGQRLMTGEKMFQMLLVPAT
jgi:hypothetical protein